MKKIYLLPLIIIVVGSTIRITSLYHQYTWGAYVLTYVIGLSIILNIFYIIMFFNNSQHKNHYLIAGLATLIFTLILLINNPYNDSFIDYPFSLKDSLVYIIKVLAQGNLFAFLGIIFLYLAAKFTIQDSSLYFSLRIKNYQFLFDFSLIILVLILIMHIILNTPPTGRTHHLIPSF